MIHDWVKLKHTNSKLPPVVSYLFYFPPLPPSSHSFSHLMGSFSSFPSKRFIITLFFLLCGLAHSEYIYPNVTASYLQFIDNSGTFLISSNGTYKAAMYNPNKQQTKFYLCIIHFESNAIIWSANRDSPVSSSGKMVLDSQGILILDEKGNKIWSTPELKSPVSSLHLTEMGSLMLIDQKNHSLWDSFAYPTDTIVIGQQLLVGTPLNSSVSNGNLSSSNYSLLVSSSDAILQWNGFVYWKLSIEPNAYRNSNYAVEYLEVNSTGLYLLGDGGRVPIFLVSLPFADFRIIKLDTSGQFVIMSYTGSDWKQDFTGPGDKCGIPFICGRVGLCISSTSGSSSPLCSCPSKFRSDPNGQQGCIPHSSSLSLPLACNSSSNNSSKEDSLTFSYLGLGNRVDYFANKFSDPDKYGVDMSICQNLCSKACSCLGFFYKNASRSCFLLHDQLGSVIGAGSRTDTLGYIKTELKPSNTKPVGGKPNSHWHGFRLLAVVILPLTAFFTLVVAFLFLWRRWKKSRIDVDIENEADDSTYSDEMEAFSIPGLPIRYAYEELKVATENFSIQIGSGGFGAVYKGVLSDQSLVAVKKITNIGLQGKRDFCTEISIIGNVHHVNLVKLKGFCAQGRERLLVYEYMNRGSLDKSLFGNGPVMEWQERFDIALGTARGLAYLHSGCVHKIIHCDVKPENILLHDQFMPKISDFGLSKLLSPEQSSHFTTMRGTRGYLAPEWLTSSAISDKTDVYSYGMVLLELVSGKKNCYVQAQSHSLNNNSNNHDNASQYSRSSSSTSGSIYFPMLALEKHEQGRYLELADPRLEGRVTGEEVEKLIKIALCCVHEDPMLRPTMVSVMGMLEGRIQLSQPCIESLTFLRFYGRRFTEPSTLEEGTETRSSLVHHQYHQPYALLPSTASGSPSSLSYISSQQVSGPR